MNAGVGCLGDNDSESDRLSDDTDREVRCAHVPRMPGIALGASDSAGGTAPPRQRVLLEGEFCVFFVLRAVRARARAAARLAAATLVSGLAVAGVAWPAPARPPPTRTSAAAGRGDRHHRWPEDVRRRRHPRRRRGPSRCPRACSRCPSTAAACCRPTASTSTTRRSGTPSTRRPPGAAPRWAATRTRARSAGSCRTPTRR